MLFSLLKGLLARSVPKDERPAIPPPSNLASTWVELDSLVRGGQHAQARSLINGLPQATRDQPEIRLCSLRLDFPSGEPAAYRTALRALLAQHPQFLPAWIELGSSALKTDEYLEAECSFATARALMPPNARLLNNLGLALFRNQKLQDAHNVFEQAVAIDGTLEAARMNLAISLLCVGHFERGWLEYEHRPSKDRPAYEGLPLPAWDGQHLGEKRLLIVAEQGLGDSIWAARFLPTLSPLGGQVTLACQKSLVPLFADSMLVGSIISTDDAVTLVDRFDLKFPLMSLPRLLHVTVEETPPVGPYLHASPSRVTEWTHRLEKARRPLVGIAWRGNPSQSNDRNRSIPLQKLEPILAACPGTLVNVQVDVRSDETPFLTGIDNYLDASALLHNFSDTAALLTHVDILVSVDTSVAHLGGALGRRTLLLRPFVPDWRWEVAERVSPWYSTVEVLQQQPFGDWRSAISAAATRVRQWEASD